MKKKTFTTLTYLLLTTWASVLPTNCSNVLHYIENVFMSRHISVVENEVYIFNILV